MNDVGQSEQCASEKIASTILSEQDFCKFVHCVLSCNQLSRGLRTSLELVKTEDEERPADVLETLCLLKFGD